MPTDQKINYLELPARDFEAIQSFYEGAFDWSFTDYGPEYRGFNDGFIDGGFYKSEASSSTNNGAALIVLYAKDLEQTRDAVLRNGGAIAKEIFSFPGWPPIPLRRSQRKRARGMVGWVTLLNAVQGLCDAAGLSLLSGGRLGRRF